MKALEVLCFIVVAVLVVLAISISDKVDIEKDGVKNFVICMSNGTASSSCKMR